MKRTSKSMQGVTLLEIMLVLAIASMVIVMSIRYYQSASTNQKITAAISEVTGIVASAESYLGAKGDLSAFNSAAAAMYLPNGKVPMSPWGGQMEVTGNGQNSYLINIPNVPTATTNSVDICQQLLALLTQNGKISGTTCTAIKVTE